MIKAILTIVLLIFIIGCAKQMEESIESTKEISIEKAVEELEPSYKYATEKPIGWFRTGQEADIVLYGTGFGDSGGSLVLNRPGKVAMAGNRLIVADSWNNRVLIWNGIPTENNQEPDLVLGQPDFASNLAGLGADGMNWPMGIATGGEKLLVADANNNRILVWDAFPAVSGQPADLVLGVPDFETTTSSSLDRDVGTHIDWPWAVWTDGEKVVVGSSGDGATLIWNTFPTKNNQPPDLIIGMENFSMRFLDTGAISGYELDPMVRIGGARSIDSDGKRLIIGTYQPPQAHIWNEFPTENGQPADMILQIRRYEDEPAGGVMGMSLKDNKLFAVGGPPLISIWNTFPTQSYQKPDIKVGVDRMHEQVVIAPDKKIFYPDSVTYAFGVASDGQKLAVADTHNDRVMIFNKIPTKSDAKADVILGKPELFVSRKSFINPTPFSDGKRLIVGSDGFGVFIYNKIPDESNAEADIVLGLGAIPDSDMSVGGKVTSDGKKLIMLYRAYPSRILIWDEMPKKDNQKPDVIIGGESITGKSGIGEAMGITTDGKSLFVADTGNNRILIWNEIPSESELPDFVLGQDDFDSSEPGIAPNRFNYPVGVSSGGKRLAVADMENQRILFWNLPITENSQMPDLILEEMMPVGGTEPLRFNLPQDVEIYNDTLFVADGGFHRVLIWSKFPETADTPPDIVLGQKDFYSGHPSNSKDGLFVPVSISFDGSYLWVGEMKWSNRLLRFSVGK